jgi:hypothetical protein
MSLYLQSKFEKAVIRVMLHLFELPKDVRGFNLKKELFDDLKIDSSNWSKLKDSSRGIPSDLHLHIRKTLINKYDVNPGFLDTNAGTMFITGKFEVHEPAHRYGKPTLTELERLGLENTELRELVNTQKKLIKRLEEDLAKSSKKSSK